MLFSLISTSFHEFGKENSEESINGLMLFLLQKIKKLYAKIKKNDFLTYINCKLAEHHVLQNA